MDLSFLPSASDNSKQRTGARFTVRPANSPYYTPSHGRGGRNQNVTHAATNGTNKEEHTLLENQDTTESRSSVRGQCEEDLPDRLTKLNQNGTAELDRAENSAFESHGRKKHELQSRSMNLNWRAELRGSDSNTRADMSAFPAKGQKQAGELEKGQTGVENVRWATKGHTFPSRMRSNSTETSLGPKGQSIMERIEKLYGSAEEQSKIRGFPPTVATADLAQQKPYKWAGGTFPRRFSSGEGNSLSSGKTLPWTPQKDKCSDSSVSARGYRRLSGGQWQEQMQGRSSEEGGGSWDKDSGTRSLDRARSRNTVAARIQSARTAAAIATEPASKACLKEETPVFKDSFDLRKRNASGSTEGSNADEDVFESYSLKVAERNKFSKTLSPPSSASVRNKINQFEALSQRAQGSVPRRAFSVPAQSSTRALGALRDNWQRGKEGEDPGDKPEKKAEEAGTKFWSERALSVDAGGLRLGREEKHQKDLVGKKHTELSGINNLDFGKYSKLKSSLELPLSTASQRCRQNLDENKTDASKVSSPGEAKRRVTNGTTALMSSSVSAAVQKPTPAQVSSPASDDDKTPTNTPSNSPYLSHTTQPDGTTSVAKTNDSTSVKTPDVPRPLATSSHSSLPGLMSADVNHLFPKGKKAFRDLDAWVAGLSSDNKWNEDDDYYEDDDESTQKDEDSNYDSDSGDSSVTITSNMSQSDGRSFCVSLSELCSFAGVDDDLENDTDDWQSSGRRSVSLSSDVSALSCVSVMPSEELDRLLEDVRSLGDITLQDYNDVQVVVLHKEMGVGLGFSLAGGLDQNKPVTVHKVFHSGVAAQEGSIREGDHVLSINGTALCGHTHWEALRVLRRAKSREMVVVVVRRGDLSGPCKRTTQGSKQGATPTHIIETGQHLCVCLEKNSRDLGFTLEGGVGSSLGDRPLIVQKIFHGGPVDKVCPGDEVLDIEGVSTVGMSRLEAWTLIRKLAPGLVNVVLHRPLKHLET